MPKAQTQDQPVLKFSATIRTITDMLGTAPGDPARYAKVVVGKALESRPYNSVPPESAEGVRQALTEYEQHLLTNNAEPVDGPRASPIEFSEKAPQEPPTPQSIFRRNKDGLILLDYQVKGFFKAAAKAMSGVSQPESKIDRWLHVGPREIPLMRDGTRITKADGISVRPLRTENMGINRVALAVSEFVNPGAELTFEIIVLPKGFSPKYSGGQIAEGEVRQWLEYGIFCGLGQWRNASHGTFEIVRFEEHPTTWAESLEWRRKQLTTTFGTELARALKT